ncbi:MAG: metallophosphoesterase, partial [bacterium]
MEKIKRDFQIVHFSPTRRILLGSGFAVLSLSLAFFFTTRGPSTAELAALDPYSSYYRVDKMLARIQSVPFDPAAGFAFAVWGDSRDSATVMDQLLVEMEKKNIVFSFSMGDMVRRGSVDDWLNNFLPVLDRHRTTPFLPVIGNHDMGTRSIEYKRLFGSTDYVFHYGNTCFLVINNNDAISNRQLAWIEENLAGEKE